MIWSVNSFQRKLNSFLSSQTVERFSAAFNHLSTPRRQNSICSCLPAGTGLGVTALYVLRRWCARVGREEYKQIFARKKNPLSAHISSGPTDAADRGGLCLVRWRPIKVQLRECHNHAVALLYEVLNWWQMQAASFSMAGEGLIKGKYVVLPHCWCRCCCWLVQQKKSQRAAARAQRLRSLIMLIRINEFYTVLPPLHSLTVSPLWYPGSLQFKEDIVCLYVKKKQRN